MAKLLQNRISESKLTLPAAVAYAITVWLFNGLVRDGLFLQFALFAATAGIMMEMNNRHTLLRIRSRMVSVSFIFLSCMANFLFADITAGVTALGTALTLTLLFMQYQDKTAHGLAFYTFAVVSAVSLMWIQMLLFVPVIWLMMIFYIQSLSWRTFAASLIGLAAPYWFAAVCFFVAGDINTPMAHIMQLNGSCTSAAGCPIQVYQVITLAVITVLTVTGGINYIGNSFKEKSHNRMLYSCLAWMTVAAAVTLLLQPRYFNRLLPVITVLASPIAAHFIALTDSRITNWTACAMAVIVIITTILNLWMPSFLYYSVTDI